MNTSDARKDEIVKKHKPRKMVRLEREDIRPEDFAAMAAKARRDLDKNKGKR